MPRLLLPCAYLDSLAANANPAPAQNENKLKKSHNDNNNNNNKVVPHSLHRLADCDGDSDSDSDSFWSWTDFLVEQAVNCCKMPAQCAAILQPNFCAGKAAKLLNTPNPAQQTPAKRKRSERVAACHASCRGRQRAANGSGQKHCVPFGSGQGWVAVGEPRLPGELAKVKSHRWGRGRVAQSDCKTFAICLREINATQIICAKVLLVAVFVVFFTVSFFGFALLLPHFLQLNFIYISLWTDRWLWDIYPTAWREVVRGTSFLLVVIYSLFLNLFLSISASTRAKAAHLLTLV